MYSCVSVCIVHKPVAYVNKCSLQYENLLLSRVPHFHEKEPVEIITLILAIREFWFYD